MGRSESGPRTAAEWAAYHALPEWEVTAVLTRTARFRVHASSPEGAQDMVTGGKNGVRSMGDLDDAGELAIASIISTEAVAGGE